MLEPWLTWLRLERGLSPHTVTAYRRELEHLARHGDPAVLGPDELRAHLAAAGGAPATVAKRIAAIKSYYRWAARRGHRSDDPSALLDRPKLPRRLPRPVHGASARIAGLDPQTRAIATLLVETGLRISELCSLDVALPVPDELIVLGKGAKERILPLTAAARAALEELGGSVPVSPRTIQRRLRAAGFSPHRLRHTFATGLADRDIDLGVIQDLLGHASPATTRIYTQNSAARLRRALEGGAP